MGRRMNWNFLGLDLGQSHDFSGMAALQRAELPGEWDPVVFGRREMVKLRLRHLERTPLGTPYPEVVDRVAQVTRTPELAARCHLIPDATGVGRPVIDLLRKSRLGCGMMPVIITGGDDESYANGIYRVPKRDLIVGLQVVIQRSGLQVAAGLELWPALEQELADLRVKRLPTGREQYGAWREGQHDDLVLALALACWGARKLYPNPPPGEEGY